MYIFIVLDSLVFPVSGCGAGNARCVIVADSKSGTTENTLIMTSV